jgi:serine/threonine protein kinase
MEKMLVFNPSKRISVDEALAHPYFSAMRNKLCETEAESKFDFNYEKVATNKDELQEMMFDEICAFRPGAAHVNPLKWNNLPEIIVSHHPDVTKE